MRKHFLTEGVAADGLVHQRSCPGIELVEAVVRLYESQLGLGQTVVGAAAVLDAVEQIAASTSDPKGVLTHYSDVDAFDAKRTAAVPGRHEQPAMHGFVGAVEAGRLAQIRKHPDELAVPHLTARLDVQAQRVCDVGQLFVLQYFVLR